MAVPVETRRPASPSRPPEGSRWTRDVIETRIFAVLRWVVIIGLVLVTLFPFYYMFILSIRPLDSLLRDPGSLVIPFGELNWSSYQNILTPQEDGGQGFLKFMGNSAMVALGTVLISLIVAIPGSYAISRLNFFGRRQVSALFLAVYLFPSILLAIPLFTFFTRLGLRGQLVALLIVYVAQVIPVTIYMLRNYFDTIPTSLEEAAALDGCSRLGVLRRISLPLAMPAIISNGLFVFMIAWNEFLFALLFLVNTRPSWTVSLGLSQLAGSIEVPTTVLMAGSVILTLPIIIIFFAAERLLTEGLTAGAEKG
ncbi:MULTISPECIES: carbohydrate ABC transporter permease [unclassified Arthrobacter]|uniref:carbohydrate ABC transporter permease n=1 Tax=unclassified Arthrobacter TaxID=235627 RepID=UPI000E1ED142|nr:MULTISPECIES: carbohydrate ABC transporter permease [unclassified Arthrobacter]MDF2048529.1 carbohydrate ABC transporter permease [Arthrobacter sp. Cr_A7]RDV08769.1 carbohydrate ABC transporter permease [Arthrobacter sp. RT-1]